jgi:hypothetical protein
MRDLIVRVGLDKNAVGEIISNLSLGDNKMSQDEKEDVVMLVRALADINNPEVCNECRMENTNFLMFALANVLDSFVKTEEIVRKKNTSKEAKTETVIKKCA